VSTREGSIGPKRDVREKTLDLFLYLPFKLEGLIPGETVLYLKEAMEHEYTVHQNVYFLYNALKKGGL
jgi:hypothetical protein